MRRFIYLLLLFASAACAQGSYTGNLEHVGCDTISGWAWYSNSPNGPWPVDIYSDSVYVTTVQANMYRADLPSEGYGNGDHGFSFATPPALKDGQNHTITADLAWTGVYLNVTAPTNVLNCPAGSTGYQYYYSDTLSSINTNNWYYNGTLSPGASGITTAGAGSLISKVSSPTGNDYEVKMTLALTATGGYYVSYLRASSNAMTSSTSPTGTFYATQLAQPTFAANGACSATLQQIKLSTGYVATLTSTAIACHNGMTVRSLIRGNLWMVYVDDKFIVYTADSDLSAGAGGVGVDYAPAGNSITRVDLGPLDTTPPNPVVQSSIAAYAQPNRIDLQWQGATDNPNGSGVAYYAWSRNGTWIGDTRQATYYSDGAVSPGTTYNYSSCGGLD